MRKGEDNNMGKHKKSSTLRYEHDFKDTLYLLENGFSYASISNEMKLSIPLIKKIAEENFLTRKDRKKYGNYPVKNKVKIQDLKWRRG